MALYIATMLLDQVLFLFIAPGDYTGISGVLLITDDSTETCVNISIVNDSEDEGDRECFAFIISTDASNGITLNTTQATVCISDDDGIDDYMFSVCIYKL